MIVVTAFILVEISGKYKVSILRNNVTWSIDNKNCKQASDFDKDEDGNTYVAYKDSIKIMRGEGTEDILFQDDSLNIENILFLLLVKVGARGNFHKKKRRPHGSSCSI